MHAADLPGDLVTLSRAATQVHASRATLWRWCLKGRLRSWRQAGHRYLVSLADVRELLQPVRTRDVSAKGERQRERAARDAWSDEVLRRHGLA